MSAGDRRVLSLREARDAIDAGEIDLLTSDVFDTLVWRPVGEPWQLFRRLADQLRADGLLRAPDVTAMTLSHARRRAERLARAASKRARGSVECTLEEIWREMPAAWFGQVDDATLTRSCAGAMRGPSSTPTSWSIL